MTKNSLRSGDLSCFKYGPTDAKEVVQIGVTNHTPQKNFTGKVIAAFHWCMNGLLGRFKEVKVKEKPQQASCEVGVLLKRMGVL